jgi:integrase
MPIRYDRAKKAFRFEFNRVIEGRRIRASKLLPKGWSQSQADAYDRKESGRIYAESTGLQRPTATIEQAVTLYIKERCPQLKNGHGTIQELARIYHAYAGRALSELPIIAREYAKAEIENLSAATIRNRLAYLRAACRYAYRVHDLGDTDPAARMQTPPVKNERHHYASRKEMLQIARLMTSRYARIAVRVAFYSGMRISEILRCEVVGDCFLLADTKNGDRRKIPIHNRLYVCLRYFPIPHKKRAVQRQFTNATAKLGLTHYHFHDLRHSAASEMINSGADLYSVGAVLGHRSGQSTKRYAHLATSTLTNVIGLIGQKNTHLK